MNQYKYLHVLWLDDTKFYVNMIKMFRNESKYFNYDEHYFITPFKSVYESLKSYDRIELVKKSEILKVYGRRAELIFLHPMSLKRKEVILIPKNIAKKIVWRTWGHDIRSIEDIEEKNAMMRICRRILDYFYKRKIHQFKAMGIANDIDSVNIENVLGTGLDLYVLPYGYRQDIPPKMERGPKVNHGTKIIMIGHNGNSDDRHFEIMEQLKVFKNQDLQLLIPLAYGDADNIKRIKEEAVKIFGDDKVKFMDEMVSRELYAECIRNVDVAILDNIYSNALGNLTLLIYFKKKIYVNRKGNFAQSFLKKGIKPNYTDTISTLSFDEFCKNNYDDRYDDYIRNSSWISRDNSSKCWKEALDKLTEK